MIGWLWRALTGRGMGPSRNRSLSRDAQREQIVRATMDLWQVSHKRKSALEQIERFEAMSRGYDGGPVKPDSKLSIRKAHYKGWRDKDFAKLVSEIRDAIASARAAEQAAQEFLRGEGVENQE